LIQFGNGFTYLDVEEMPIYERHFFVRKLQEYLAEERRQKEEAERGMNRR
jgi:hypothetical protein